MTQPERSCLLDVLEARKLSLWRRVLLACAGVAVGAAIWLPVVHLFFTPGVDDYLSADAVSPKAKELSTYHLRLWTNPELRKEEIGKMRSRNREWDFMGRTFFALALANMALREPSLKAQYLDPIDRIIEETIRLEADNGIYFFLLDYAKDREFVHKPARSIFVDGEIALMLGARRLVEEKPEYKAMLPERVETMLDCMRNGPVLCAESYPDECWMFCNTVALAAIKISDVLDGTDHSEFFREWVANAKQRLVDPETGMLASSFSLKGRFIDGPEGSTIWMAAHCLSIIDERFARDQYERGKKELAVELAGFGWAREWPRSCVGPEDVDSGPVIPVMEASSGSSGLALMGSSAFGDRDYFGKLCTSLNFAGFPVERDGALKYCASNQVGDAVMLYAMVLGPLWQKVKQLDSDR
ncbi:MAG: hypothetical protein RDV41_05685 [Planctomycetota bacterium]|nr:hypothetical protein [Planctomycetota bacterium]